VLFQKGIKNTCILKGKLNKASNEGMTLKRQGKVLKVRGIKIQKETK